MENRNGWKMFENKKLKLFELMTEELAKDDDTLRYSCSSLIMLW